MAAAINRWAATVNEVAGYAASRLPRANPQWPTAKWKTGKPDRDRHSRRDFRIWAQPLKQGGGPTRAAGLPLIAPD